MTLCWNKKLLSQYVAFNYRDYQTACVTKATGPLNHHGVKWLWSGMEVDMTILTFFFFFLLLLILLSFLSCFRSLFLSSCLYLRRWGRGWGGRGTSAILFRLCHALPDCVLEGSVRLRPAHGILERVGVFHCFHSDHRSFDCCDRWSGQSLRLHHWPKGLSHRCGVCSPGNIHPWWVCVCFYLPTFL